LGAEGVEGPEEMVQAVRTEPNRTGQVNLGFWRHLANLTGLEIGLVWKWCWWNKMLYISMQFSFFPCHCWSMLFSSLLSHIKHLSFACFWPNLTARKIKETDISSWQANREKMYRKHKNLTGAFRLVESAVVDPIHTGPSDDSVNPTKLTENCSMG